MAGSHFPSVSDPAYALREILARAAQDYDLVVRIPACPVEEIVKALVSGSSPLQAVAVGMESRFEDAVLPFHQ